MLNWDKRSLSHVKEPSDVSHTEDQVNSKVSIKVHVSCRKSLMLSAHREEIFTETAWVAFSGLKLFFH